MLNKKYFSKFRTIKKLGEGSFGKVYKAEYNNEYFALKFENRSKGQSLLENEATIMTYLKGPNIPYIKSFGYSGDYNILVMQLLDKSLEDIFNKRKKFSVKTTCMLGYQMITVLQYIHDRHIIHRDIKPDNFVMGANENNAHLYLLDFGLAKKYRSSRTLIQYPLVKKKKLTGTARYASIHALEELEQSRRDDLESVGYVLMYFLRGGLPWQGLKIRSKEDRYKKILIKKKETSSEELCKNFPEEFKDFVEYTRNLEYTEQPDYDRLKSSFFNLVTKKMGELFDFRYDWTTESDMKKRKENDIIDLAPSTNYPVSEKKSTQKEMSINSKKVIQQPVNSEKEGNNNNNIIIDGQKENDNNFQSKCCIIF
jgi:serine/threonine protein kinase